MGIRSLADEAKNRMIFLLITSVGLSYFMSLTSSSVWVNLPVSVSLIIFIRYLSFGLDVRKRSVASSKQASVKQASHKISIDLPKSLREKSNWRTKVNSPEVEEAIDHFTRHLISEWIIDLWYSRITPDKGGPEELVQIVNGALAEISARARNVNLVHLITRDIVNLFRNHLELYRRTQSKIGQKELAKLSSKLRDAQLKLVLAAENSLHPGLFSADAEHKVLQHLMDGLISLTLKSEDLQCTFFHYTARELLACAVMRPILNLANPRLINEKIESFAVSLTNKSVKEISHVAQVTSSDISNEPLKPRSMQLFGTQDQSAVGVELVQVKENRNLDKHSRSNINGFERDDRQLTDVHKSGSYWARDLDAISRIKTQSLEPEHLENMWVKGRNYKNKENAQIPVHQVGILDSLSPVKTNFSRRNMLDATQIKFTASRPDLDHLHEHSNGNFSANHEILINQHDMENSDTESSYPSEDEETNNVMGLDSPGTKVWDGKNKTTISSIRHPLETSDIKLTKKNGKLLAFNSNVSKTVKKRHRLSNQKMPIWQDVERSPKRVVRKEYLSDDSEAERWVRAHSGMATSSSMPSILVSETSINSAKTSESSLLADTFLKLRCEVLGANIVKSGSGTFTVYSIAVTDADDNSWSIKRRFRHFEELHRLLRDFAEYNLNLPPKHFLSSGLNVSVVKERCIFLDKYLKELLQIPIISSSIEVWDFLSVDSQTYTFSDSLSIIQTLSVNLNEKPSDQNNVHASLSGTKPQLALSDGLLSTNIIKRNTNQNQSNISVRDGNSHQDIAVSDSATYNASTSVIHEKPVNVLIRDTTVLQDTPSSGTQVTRQHVSPNGPNLNTLNLSAPILDLVDAIFMFQDGGWIRRQAFWVAKQVLQLGMGDAFDDWLIEKILLLRRSSVIVSLIGRIEKMLWPDGIFITKHPKRRISSPKSSQNEGSSKRNNINEQLNYEEQVTASRHAKFVRELIIDKAPAALISIVGRKEYESCAEDIYNFLQSPVCLKHMAFELLELLLVAAFPELIDVVRSCHEERERFGKLEEQ